MFEMRHAAAMDNNHELEQDALAELTKLQRQYRIMENDKKAYIAETFNLIEKQQKQIRDFELQKYHLDASLERSRSNQYLSKDVDNFLRIRDLLKLKEEYIAHIKEEREKSKELEKEQLSVQHQINYEWKKVGGKQALQEQSISLVKKCRRTENLLEQGMKEYNRLLADNHHHRSEIENLINVRRQFNFLHGKLSHYLGVTKTDMSQTISQATQAFDQREECQTKMQSLRDRWDKEDTQYQQELRDLQRTLAHDHALKTFVTLKTQDRPLVLGRKTNQGTRKLSDVENNVEFYRKAFNKIAAMTGEENIETLVERILRTEEENFALFNYVNELNREVEQYQAGISKLRAEIVELRMHGQERELRRQEEIRNLEISLESQTQEMDNAEDNLRSSKKAFEGLLDGLQNIFNKTHAAKLVEESLLEEGEINVKNIMAFMSAIEQRATQLLIINDYLSAKSEGRRSVMRPSPATLSSTLPKIDYSIPMPTITLVDDVEEDEDMAKPLKRNEIKELVEKERKLKMAMAAKFGASKTAVRKKPGVR